jgi:cytochrome c biogenesis protein CcmG/thiol:disulfide interchange protein DsbE
MPDKKRPKQPPKKSPVPLIAALLGVIAVLALVAVIATGVSEEKAADDRNDDLDQVHPVDVDGSLPPLERGGADPAVGEDMPELAGSTFDGSAVRIENDGRPKVLFFLAHWCPHCQREVPVIVDYLEEEGQPEGVDLFGVSTAVDEGRPNFPPSRWLEQESWPAPVLADTAEGTAAEAYGVSGFPFFVAIDADGKVVARHAGPLGRDALAQLIESLERG